MLSKTAALFLKPLFWSIILLIAAIVLRGRKPGWSRRLLAAAAVILIAFSNPVLLGLALRAWEVPASAREAEGTSHDIGIILGGYSDPRRSSEDRLVLGSSPNRLTEALRLYKTGRIRKLVLSGGSGALFGEKQSEAPLARAFLIDLGIPQQDILVEPDSRNTHENAVFTAKLLDETRGRGQRVLLVTSAMHMRRAMACFDRAGIAVTPYSTDMRGDAIDFTDFRSLLPDAWALWTWEFLIKEWVGLLAYRATGRA